MEARQTVSHTCAQFQGPRSFQLQVQSLNTDRKSVSEHVFKTNQFAGKKLPLKTVLTMDREEIQLRKVGELAVVNADFGKLGLRPKAKEALFPLPKTLVCVVCILTLPGIRKIT